MDTPIAFLVFNRPETTARVFSAIRQAKPQKLLVVADGPRSTHPTEAAKCAEVRTIIQSGIDWKCDLLTNFADNNMGCGQRISSGLDWVFDHVPEAIILEDDCLPHQDFFRFANVLLNRYRDDKRVMMIAGTNLLKTSPHIVESYLFCQSFPIWGWATWRRAWSLYDFHLKAWREINASKRLRPIRSPKLKDNYLNLMFDRILHDQIDTWDFQWAFACLSNNGLAAIPKNNLVTNIGISGSHNQPSNSPNHLPTFDIGKSLIYPKHIFPDHVYERDLTRLTLGGPLMLAARILVGRVKLWRHIARNKRSVQSNS